MKRTLIGALCLSLLAIGCSDQPQPETEQEPQPEVKQESQSVTPVETPDVQTETEEGTSETEVEKNIDAWVEDAFDELSKWLAVNEAIKEHDVETMRKLLKEGVDFTFQPDGNTYAAQCVLANFPDGLKVLKEFDFDFDMLNKRTGVPTLLIATSPGGDFNCLEMARLLLECGASVDASVDAEVMDLEDPSLKGLDGLTPFYSIMLRAIGENDKEAFDIARFLLEHGADPDKTPTGVNGETLLQRAIFEKNLPAVEFLLKHGASVTKERYDGATALKIVAQRGTPAKIRQAVAANVKVCDFTIFGITLGQPLPKEIDKQINWAADNDPFDDPLWGGRGTDETEDTSALWKMPKRFRRFNQTLSITRTPSSHRISQIGTIALIDGELQQKEEAEVVRDALVKKFGIDFQENSYAQTWTGYKDGAEIHIWYREDHVGLMISVADEETLQLIDDLSRERADDVETDLDVL